MVKIIQLNPLIFDNLYAFNIEIISLNNANIINVDDKYITNDNFSVLKMFALSFPVYIFLKGYF